tara:strand:+ start:886 stop:3297 length:2412 start_codon:yes stop_codon:yes gene_type:complete
MNINNYLKPGKSINVIAAAGTGKTWIIISKILRLLLDGVSPDKITAITFTKKSSAEMMERLNAKIELWSNLELHDLEIELNKIGITENIKIYLDKAKRLFVNVQLGTKDIRISTFDAFFVEILSVLHLDKDINKNIKTNSYRDLISKNVINKIFNNQYLIDNLHTQININFLINNIGLHNTKESIRNIINKKSYYLEIRENLRLKDKSSNINQRLSVDKEEYVTTVNNIIKNNKIGDKYNDLSKFLSSNDIDIEKKVLKIQNFFLTNDKKPRVAVLNYLKKNNINEDIFIDEINKYDEKIYYEIQNSWKVLAEVFFQEYQNYLKIDNLYDYEDITWLCYKKLSDMDKDDWVFFKIANSINHILIDEFQDTNYMQWKIIEMILDAMNNLSDTNSVTIVGDTYQSIYGFRGSEPKLFKQCSDYTKRNFNAKDLFLNESRRSSKEVVKFVNHVFKDREGEFFTNIKDQGLVEINNIEYTCENIYELESILLSEKILKITKDKNTSFKDILILTRNRTHIKFIEEELIKNSIPVSAYKKISLLDSAEILDLNNLLKYLILGEDNNYELFTLLISPIFNYSLEQLGSCNIKKFCDLEDFIFKSKNSEHIASWKKLIGKIPMHDLLDKIYYDLNIIDLYRTSNDLKNNEIKNNFLNFLNLSLKVNNGRYVTPFQFLLHIEQVKDYPESFEHASSDSVKIMTIHSAKGLESDVVFLAQTYRNNARNNKLKIYPKFNSDFSCKDMILYVPGICKHNKNINSILDSCKAKEDVEEENLLYVACTRAKRTLVVNGCQDKKSEGSWFSSSLVSE